MKTGRSLEFVGSPALSWRELKAFLKHLPPDSAFASKKTPMAAWSTPNVFMSMLILDTLNGANWQRGGGRGAKPQPFREKLRKAVDKPPVDYSMTPEKMQIIRNELAARRKGAAVTH